MKIEIRSFLEPEKEAKLRNALLNAEKCPFHDELPEIIGPQRKFIDPNPESYEPSIWRIPSSWRIETALHELFPDALLFPTINWTCFCKKCAKKNPRSSKHNIFGYGLCSSYSWQAALRNWNSACCRFYKRLVKDDLNIMREDSSEQV